MSGIPAKNGKGFNPNPSPFFNGLPLLCIIVNIVKKNRKDLGMRLPHIPMYPSLKPRPFSWRIKGPWGVWVRDYMLVPQAFGSQLRFWVHHSLAYIIGSLLQLQNYCRQFDQKLQLSVVTFCSDDDRGIQLKRQQT